MIFLFKFILIISKLWSQEYFQKIIRVSTYLKLSFIRTLKKKKRKKQILFPNHFSKHDTIRLQKRILVIQVRLNLDDQAR